MRRLIIATAALALLSSTAFAQDKAGSTTTAPAASGDAMSKGDTMKKPMKKKSKKSAMKKTDDATPK